MKLRTAQLLQPWDETEQGHPHFLFYTDFPVAFAFYRSNFQNPASQMHEVSEIMEHHPVLKFSPTSD